VADWTGTSALASRLITALEDTIATSKIYFSVCGWLITPYYLSQVARAIRLGKIGVGQGTEGTAHYSLGLAPKKGATPQDEGNFFNVDLPLYTTVNRFYVNNRALVIHEAVHAIHDMFARPIKDVDDEASAYIAQAVYCLDNSSYYCENWKTWLGQGDLSAEACRLAEKVLDGVVNVDTVFPTEYFDLKSKIIAHPLYRDEITYTSMSGCNGIGGFTPDKSPDYAPSLSGFGF